MAIVILGATSVTAQDAAPIADNSFLVEEAYNQEAGVVQHISTFSRANGGEAWDYTFTQEWPLAGIRNQLSYTVPLAHADGSGTGLGDVALNYRYQLVGAEEGAIHVAPRASLLLPTGSEDDGRGAGALGFQTNLPVSYVVAPAIATHWNAGMTVIPSASGPLGTSATTVGFNLGGSAIWRVRRAVNLMLEAVWFSNQTPIREGETFREESAFLNPGVRWAFDFDSGLQIVPGVAYTIGLGPSSGDNSLFLYLSFEHAFKR
jgi:Putative MetA-pathway of phenol degradation